MEGSTDAGRQDAGSVHTGTRFSGTREAKEWAVAAIVREAAAQGVPLSELERKTLYFSEGGWTLPDMAEVSATFDAEYDSQEYEAKIAGLIRAALRKGDQQTWRDAAAILGEEDHYILVMMEQAGGQPPRERTVSRWRDRALLWATALATVCGFLLVLYLGDRLGLW